MPVNYRFGRFELDPASGRLFRDQARVRLTGPQLAILAHLVANAGVVVSKDALLDIGWGGLAVAPNSLDQAIHRLRKLQPAAYIETRHSHGYRFAAVVERVDREIAEGPLDAQLEPFLASMQARMQLDTLDRAAIQQARLDLEAVIRRQPDHPRALALLAMACGLAFEASVVDLHPDTAVLAAGVGHARRARDLAPSSGEAWSALAFVLNLSGSTTHAIAAAQKAIDLEPDNWRHALRLAKVTWGEERLQAARHVLALFPGLALAHWLRATVFVARGALDAALEELRLGCAAQDAQKEGSPFPAVGLHLLHGLVLAAHGRLDEAIEAFMRELSSGNRGQVYATLCAANTWYAIGAVRAGQRRHDEAATAYARALASGPGHVPAIAALRGEVPSLAGGVDRVVGEAIILARANRHGDAARLYRDALVQAPPGEAGWILPVEPLLNPSAHPTIWAEALALIRLRAT